ncbi:MULTISPECIES: rhodanese-like domain-containing protein [Rufibacter]|uniref:Rhodanese-related sulfurtransferase n=1 Tax=Rufibacter quisquiliarum TaxID=1549639 RepID=A0A839GNY7_9BACT|nr:MULTISPECIES: rhodanese-like domain-containing protein [Rufibacter]MBA9079673.1 rhodanese-related sulfurtransferase [Rufibacter quisquiliarum]
MIPEITPRQLKERLDRQENLQLIDVREPEEWAICHLGGQLIPLGELTKAIDQIAKDTPTVLICHHGFRSAQALMFLQQRHGFTNLLNLKGGVHAWAQEVDPEFPVY